MKPLTQKLADYLELDGWNVSAMSSGDLEWWADEIWELRSLWSPLGLTAFMIFLVDPMWNGERMKGQGVWAVTICSQLPRDRMEAEKGAMIRVHASKSEIEKFIEQVDKLRSAS